MRFGCGVMEQVLSLSDNKNYRDNVIYLSCVSPLYRVPVRPFRVLRLVSFVREQDGWVSVASEETTDRFADVSDAFCVLIEYGVRFLAGCWFTVSHCVTVSFD